MYMSLRIVSKDRILKFFPYGVVTSVEIGDACELFFKSDSLKLLENVKFYITS